MSDVKPRTSAGYSSEVTAACERALVTLMGAFGTLSDTIRLVGGLAPRYIIGGEPPEVPEHAGTSDVDVVLNLAVIAEGENYADLATQLEAVGFRSTTNKSSLARWKWTLQVDNLPITVEFLRDAAGAKLTRAVPIDGENVTAMPIPHAGIAHEWFIEHVIEADHIFGGNVRTKIRVIDAVGFLILKALAVKSRMQPKDSADLIYVLENAGDIDHVANLFVEKFLSGQHEQALVDGIEAMEEMFVSHSRREDWEMGGPQWYGEFHYKNASEDERVAAQRYAAALVGSLLDAIEAKRRQARRATLKAAKMATEGDVA